MRRQRNLLGPQGMGGMVSLWGAPSLVESVQYGTISTTADTSGTATITAVDTTRSVVLSLGQFCTDTTANSARMFGSLVLTNSTTVTMTKDLGTANVDTGFCVVQFRSGVVRSIQYAQVINSLGPTGTAATISAVNLNTTMFSWGSLRTSANSYLNSVEGLKATISSNTSILMQNGYTGGSGYFYLLCLEFF